MPRIDTRQRTARLALALIGALAFLSTWRYHLDDLYIFAAFARNLWRGYGFAYHPLDQPTYGVTGPLYLLLLAPFADSATGVLLAAKAIGLVATVWSVLRLADLVAGTDPSPSTLEAARWAAALALLNPLTVRWLACGLETPLGTAGAIALAHWVCGRPGPPRARPARSLGIAMVFLLLIRPEFIILYGCVLVATLTARWSPSVARICPGLAGTAPASMAWLALPGLGYSLWLAYACLRPDPAQ